MTSWLSRVHSELTLRRLSLLERLVLAAIILSALAMWIRFAQLRVFVGDEVGTLKLLHWRSSALLSQFDRHLTMNYFILAEKYLARLFGAPDWRLSLLPLAGA